MRERDRGKIIAKSLHIEVGKKIDSSRSSVCLLLQILQSRVLSSRPGSQICLIAWRKLGKKAGQVLMQGKTLYNLLLSTDQCLRRLYMISLCLIFQVSSTHLYVNHAGLHRPGMLLSQCLCPCFASNSFPLDNHGAHSFISSKSLFKCHLLCKAFPDPSS